MSNATQPNCCVAAVIRETLTDGSCVFNVWVSETTAEGAERTSIVLSPVSEAEATQLQQHLVTLGGCVDGGCNY